MLWRGPALRPRSAADAKAAGIAFIHQELNLFTNLTVAENLFIDGFPAPPGSCGAHRPPRHAGPRARDPERLALDIPAERTLDSLSPGERQLVEIARALHREASLIIFDEPTTSLTHRETERLFGVIEGLRREGTDGDLHLPHPADVKRLADRVAVLRDGASSARGPSPSSTSPHDPHHDRPRPRRRLPARTAAPRERPVLEVRGLSAPGVIEDVTLSVREGEILGLFGLMGSGRSELARILMGLDPATRGRGAAPRTPLTGRARASACARASPS
jgi:ribose transport system ATP-binding protein